MEKIVCSKCELDNNYEQDYCQLCGANLKGGQDSIPGKVYIVQIPKSPYLDTYIAWEDKGIYFIFMANISAYVAGEFGFGPIKDVARKEKISQFKKNIFHLPLNEQLKIQKGVFIGFDDIREIKDEKRFISTASPIEVISKQGKILATIRGSDRNRDNFRQEALTHGINVN